MSIMQTIDNQVIDHTETLILMALGATKDSYTGNKTHCYKGVGGVNVSEMDVGEDLNIKPMVMSTAYTFDLVDNERLYSPDYDLLMSHPSDLIGDQIECIMIDHEKMKWSGIMKIQKPSGISCLGKASHWYALHFRVNDITGKEFYSKRIIALNKNGRFLPCIREGAFIGAKKDIENIITSLSIKEDAMRSNAMLATIRHEGKEVITPVPISDYKEVFIGRDGPYSGKRKKSIIHKVISHSRKLKGNKTTIVPSHLRGIQEFDIDGFNVKICPNKMYI